MSGAGAMSNTENSEKEYYSAGEPAFSRVLRHEAVQTRHQARTNEERAREAKDVDDKLEAMTPLNSLLYEYTTSRATLIAILNEIKDGGEKELQTSIRKGVSSSIISTGGDSETNRAVEVYSIDNWYISGMYKRVYTIRRDPVTKVLEVKRGDGPWTVSGGRRGRSRRLVGKRKRRTNRKK